MSQIIILEGPDGAGKTTLLHELAAEFKITIAPRASSSIGGPVDELFNWVADDLHKWALRPKRSALYDRHPLVSEFIYGPIIRGSLHPTFIDNPSLQTFKNYFRSNSLLVICLPPLSVTEANLLKDPANQMPGVLENHVKIYNKYRDLVSNWAGRAVVYDYTDRLSRRSLSNRITYYLEQRRAEND